MLKVKHERTADCVVGGFRTHKDGGGVGSLLLGLYDDEGTLHHVGVASGFAVARRKEFVDALEPYRADALAGHPWNWGEGADPAGGCPAARAAGTRARTCRGSRSGPSSCARCPTTTSRATASATPPRSALAQRPRPGVVHLRPARHARPRGARPRSSPPTG